MNKKILAIIGIRSGSKGLKNKNIKILGNKPLVAWIIKAAKSSKLINKIIVSTDNSKYRNIAKKYGAEAPFLRPKKYAKDSSSEIEFIKHSLKWLKNNENYSPDLVLRLLATVPFQKSKDLDLLIKQIFKKKLNSAVIITEAKQHPRKALKIKDNKLVNYFTEKGKDVGANNNRQNYSTAFFRANVIAFKPKIINQFNSLTDDNVGFLKINNKKFIDIDDINDFKLAEYYLKVK